MNIVDRAKSIAQKAAEIIAAEARAAFAARGRSVMTVSRGHTPSLMRSRVGRSRTKIKGDKMNLIINTLIKLGILNHDLDYNFARAAMVIIFLFFGYQKWFDYEAQALIPYISNGPLLFWMYPVFGVRGATWFLGVAEWGLGALLFAGFWNKRLGILGALGSCFAFISTITIIPFIPNGWAPSAGGFPAMTETTAFLLKDLILLSVSVYLLRQDVIRVSVMSEPASKPGSAPFKYAASSLEKTGGQ
jgi:uncharacterized membrane protein YkgB